MAEKRQAVIASGGKQYLVTEGETLEVELIKDTKKTLVFEPMLVLADNKATVGKPFVSDVKVSAEVVEPEVKADKVTSIRYKSKKRVHKVRGHRQRHTLLKITKIA